MSAMRRCESSDSVTPGGLLLAGTALHRIFEIEGRRRNDAPAPFRHDPRGVERLRCRAFEIGVPARRSARDRAALRLSGRIERDPVDPVVVFD